MFKTNRKAELLPGLSRGPNGVQFWSYIEQEIAWPWFYLQIVEDNGDEAFRSMLMVPSIPLLELFIAAQTETAWFEQAQLVTPQHINNRGRWMMEPLLEVSSILDTRGNELGHLFQVEGGHTYSSSASQHPDGRLSTHVVFSASLHLRS
jgi:hypothetical protein